ncbi:MAG: hypothetical protein LC650_02720 [Actinobacteria bacterium]|nr:hypothetical protein [Actinomycetota bacterium]
MGTRSAIALAHEDGTVEAIYCHWDGYVECNGRILDECYQDRSKVQELIDLGDLSALNDTAAECEAYHRDRGEDFDMVVARRYGSYQMMIEDELEDSDREYLYVFLKNDTWAVISKHDYNRGAHKLSDAIAELNRSKLSVV